MWFILQEDDIYFPSLSLFISYKVNLPDSILSLPHQDGGEKAQVLVTPPWLVKKLCWTGSLCRHCVMTPDSQLVLYFVSAINHSLLIAKADTMTFSRTVKDPLWVEINFVSQILGYCSKLFFFFLLPLQPTWDFHDHQNIIWILYHKISLKEHSYFNLQY